MIVSSINTKSHQSLLSNNMIIAKKITLIFPKKNTHPELDFPTKKWRFFPGFGSSPPPMKRQVVDSRCPRGHTHHLPSAGTIKQQQIGSDRYTTWGDFLWMFIYLKNAEDAEDASCWWKSPGILLWEDAAVAFPGCFQGGFRWGCISPEVGKGIAPWKQKKTVPKKEFHLWQPLMFVD